MIFYFYKNTDQISKDNSIDKSQSLTSNNTLNNDYYKNERKKFYERNKIKFTNKKIKFI